MKRLLVADADGTLVRGEEAITTSSSQGGDGVEWHYFTQRSGFPLLPRRGGGGEQQCENTTVAVGFTEAAKAQIAVKCCAGLSTSSPGAETTAKWSGYTWADVQSVAARTFFSISREPQNKEVRDKVGCILRGKVPESVEDAINELDALFTSVGTSGFLLSLAKIREYRPESVD
jgi:hypothetical protein